MFRRLGMPSLTGTTNWTTFLGRLVVSSLTKDVARGRYPNEQARITYASMSDWPKADIQAQPRNVDHQEMVIWL